jgi:thiamine transport system permease protein
MRWLAAVPIAFVGFAFALPMALVLVEGAQAWDFATGPYARRVLSIALEQAAWSTLAAMAVAIPLAWLHHERAVPGGRLQSAIHAAPFVMPVFVIVYGLQGVLGPRSLLEDATGWNLLAWLGPLGTVVLAHAYYNYGFAARILEANLRRRPRRLEEAARTLGASPWSAFRRVSLPHLLPAGLAVALLVFLFSFGSFGVVLFMGQGKVHTLETAMYGEVNTLFAQPGRAAALGILQLGVNALLLFAYVALRRRSSRNPAEPEASPRKASRILATSAWAVTALAALPIASVLVQGFRLKGEWSLEPWRFLLIEQPLGFDLATALGRSLLYASGSTLLALALAAALAYGARDWPRLRRPMEALASLPVAGSGVLLGVAFLSSFGTGALLDIEGTHAIVLLGHTVLAFPFVVRLVQPAFESRDVRLEEAARLLGAPPASVAARVQWPQLRPAVLAAAGLAAAMSLGDFGASSLLMVHDTRSLSVWIAQVDAPFDALRNAAAVALAGLLCALTLAAYVLVERAGRRTA